MGLCIWIVCRLFCYGYVHSSQPNSGNLVCCIHFVSVYLYNFFFPLLVITHYGIIEWFAPPLIKKRTVQHQWYCGRHSCQLNDGIATLFHLGHKLILFFKIRLSGSTKSGPLSTFANQLDNTTQAKMSSVSGGDGSIFLSATVSSSEILLLVGLPGNMNVGSSFGITNFLSFSIFITLTFDCYQQLVLVFVHVPWSSYVDLWFLRYSHYYYWYRSWYLYYFNNILFTNDMREEENIVL
jgi:hypothetical protein